MTFPLPGGASAPDDAPARWRMLALLALAELLGMSLWLTGSAVAPQLQERWSLTGGEVAWLTIAVDVRRLRM